MKRVKKTMTLKECMSIVAGMKWADDAVCVFTFNNRYPFERFTCTEE